MFYKDKKKSLFIIYKKIEKIREKEGEKKKIENKKMN